MTMRAKAVADKGPDSNLNVVVLDPTASPAVQVQGSSNIQISGALHVNSCAGGPGCSGNAVAVIGGCCDITANGGVFVTGSATGNVTPLTTGTPPIADPMASLAPPTVPGANGACAAGVCTPGRYIGGLHLNGGTWTLQPGLYYIDGGGISFTNNATVTGNGVTLYNGGTSATYGPLELTHPNTVVSLNAPSSGTYRAVVYYQDRSNTVTASIRQGEIVLNGVIYMPSAELQFGPGGGGTPDDQVLHAIFIVRRLNLHGGPLLADNDLSGFGGSPLQRVSLAE
jgi:hypothetical protein